MARGRIVQAFDQTVLERADHQAFGQTVRGQAGQRGPGAGRPDRPGTGGPDRAGGQPERPGTGRPERPGNRPERPDGVRTDPKAGKETLAPYSERWLTERTLEDRTRELYQGLLDRHIVPTFGATPIAEIRPSTVRSWNAALARRYPTTAAKAYRLLRTILATAVTDDVLTANPCRVDGERH